MKTILKSLKKETLKIYRSVYVSVCVLYIHVCVYLSSYGMHVEVRIACRGQFSSSTMRVYRMELRSSLGGEHPGTRSITATLFHIKRLGCWLLYADNWRRSSVRPSVGNVTRWHCLITDSKWINLFLPFLDTMSYFNFVLFNSNIEYY